MRKSEFCRAILKEEFWVNIEGFEIGLYIRYEFYGGKIVWYNPNGSAMQDWGSKYLDEFYQKDSYTKAQQRDKKIDQILTD